jgi:hypothetical protein
MPRINVGSLVTDPDFSETFQVTVQYNTITSAGVQTSLSTTTSNATGVVTPGKQDLRRLDDGTRVNAYIDVFTQFPLSTGGRVSDSEERVADIVTWKGNKYVVASIRNFSNYGFIQASCDLIQINPGA